MGADLIGVGFTHNTDKECNLDTLKALIDAIPAAKLADNSFLTLIDPSDGFAHLWDQDDEAFADDVRDSLKSGADEYVAATQGHRGMTEYNIGETSLWFVWAGGMSWGDDPFDGFTELCYFVNLAEHDEAIAEAAAFVAHGLPRATQIAQCAGSGE